MKFERGRSTAAISSPCSRFVSRCGAYPGIVAAIQEAHSGRETARTWRFVGDEELARVRKEASDEAV